MSHTFNKTEAGYSILETIAVLGILMVLTLFAIPSFPAIFQTTRAAQLEGTLAEIVQRTQQTAKLRQARAYISLNNQGDAYSVWLDFYPYSTSPSPEQLAFQGALPERTAISGVQEIIFDSRGVQISQSGAVTTAALALQIDGLTYRSVVITPIGRVRLDS